MNWGTGSLLIGLNEVLPITQKHFLLHRIHHIQYGPKSNFECLLNKASFSQNSLGNWHSPRRDSNELGVAADG
jgi:hypothetical protein